MLAPDASHTPTSPADALARLGPAPTCSAAAPVFLALAVLVLGADLASRFEPAVSLLCTSPEPREALARLCDLVLVAWPSPGADGLLRDLAARLRRPIPRGDGLLGAEPPELAAAVHITDDWTRTRCGRAPGDESPGGQIIWTSHHRGATCPGCLAAWVPTEVLKAKLASAREWERAFAGRRKPGVTYAGDTEIADHVAELARREPSMLDASEPPSCLAGAVVTRADAEPEPLFTASAVLDAARLGARDVLHRLAAWLTDPATGAWDPQGWPMRLPDALAKWIADERTKLGAPPRCDLCKGTGSCGYCREEMSVTTGDDPPRTEPTPATSLREQLQAEEEAATCSLAGVAQFGHAVWGWHNYREGLRAARRILDAHEARRPTPHQVAVAALSEDAPAHLVAAAALAVERDRSAGGA